MLVFPKYMLHKSNKHKNAESAQMKSEFGVLGIEKMFKVG